MAKKVSITLLLAFCLWGVSGGVALAVTDPSAGGLVTCGRATDASGKALSAQQQAESCNFAAAVAMINRLIDYIIVFATSLAAVSFAYAGWLRLSAGDNSGQVTKSNKIFTSVGIGFIVILSAWLVFKFIETTFLNTSNGYATYLS